MTKISRSFPSDKDEMEVAAACGPYCTADVMATLQAILPGIPAFIRAGWRAERASVKRSLDAARYDKWNGMVCHMPLNSKFPYARTKYKQVCCQQASSGCGQ